jgi:hypothetical protein
MKTQKTWKEELNQLDKATKKKVLIMLISGFMVGFLVVDLAFAWNESVEEVRAKKTLIEQ